jgi:hypothetical protein
MCSSVSTSSENCQWCTTSFCGNVSVIQFGVAIGSVAYDLEQFRHWWLNSAFARVLVCVCARVQFLLWLHLVLCLLNTVSLESVL